MKLLAFVLLNFATHAAFALEFSCKLDSNKSVQVFAEVQNSSMVVRIKDLKEVLEIPQSVIANELILNRIQRVKEAQYSFSNYHTELNAWKDLAVSIPKKITNSYFKAYLTIFQDDGDRMVPGESFKLSCLVR